MPRLRCGHQPEPCQVAGPRFERRDLDAHTLGTQDVRHARTWFEGDDLEIAREPFLRRLAGASADLERAVPRPERAELDDRVEYFIGVARPRFVVELGYLAEDRALFALGAHPASTAGVSFSASSKMRAVHPAISTGGSSSSTTRAAMPASSRAAADSGCASTTGRPVSPPSDTADSMGTRPTSGAPVSAASRWPPPAPKIACCDPSGATNSLMFSTMPSTLR